jgi:hypothetical protein
MTELVVEPAMEGTKEVPPFQYFSIEFDMAIGIEEDDKDPTSNHWDSSTAGLVSCDNEKKGTTIDGLCANTQLWTCVDAVAPYHTP